MEFITILHPGQPVSANLRRQAHSHAARVSHARARRLRVATHRRQKDVAATAVAPSTATGETSGAPPPTQTTEMDVAPPKRKQYQAQRDETTLFAPGAISSPFRHEPLASFIQSLNTRECYMFDHYIRVVVPYLDHHCPVMQYLGEYHEYIRKNWILLSSTDADLLRGFLLAACRHLSLVHLNKDYTQFALEYKLDYVQSLRKAISEGNPSSRRIAVTRALVLALDEIMLGDNIMASKHVAGAYHIVKMSGGARALGLSKFVSGILDGCISGKRLLDKTPVFRCSPTFMKPESIMV
ncbi:hypothetical protein BGZ63DRAFT_255019 [Mariannaea sp. PMI_226]|nr:hypothetical protein BGZ63DRAFT_255019 [Mariannaea sp. PMI_226]